MYISINEASRQYFIKGKGSTNALHKVNLDIEKGEFICLLGPSGCGKSTLLNLIAGFDKPTSGSVKINGEAVTKPSENRITIFQNYGLLPWRNVLRNVELGLEAKNIPKKKRRVIAEEYIELVGLSPYKTIIQRSFQRNAAESGIGKGFGSGSRDTAYGRAFWCPRCHDPNEHAG